MKSYRGEIEKLIPSLRQYARALVSNHRADIADDLVQDALAQALRAEPNWWGEDVAIKLYGRITESNRTRMRSGIGQRRSGSGSAAQADISKSVGARRNHIHDPADHLPASGMSTAGLPGLESLSMADREALLLVAVCRLDYPQAAQVLGIPVAVLITRLTHARDHLGNALWAAPAPTSGDHRAVASPKRQPPTHLRLVKS